MKSANPLFKKYDVPAPRYTSYPTVPYWVDSPDRARWLTELSNGLAAKDAKISIYVHVPFCETLCTFCGCNTTITKDHKRENPYVTRLLRELELYVEKIPNLGLRETACVHFGGGTPTFLAAPELERLVRGMDRLLKRVDKDFEGSIEVDPRRTEMSQLKVLRDLGFSRVSLGVQDFDPEVQRLVNRVQPFEQTKAITDAARALGYTSVNFDLIYGLPKQTLASIDRMIQQTLLLRPNRIALYSFALVPWIKPAQRLFKDEDLPDGEAKRALYESARHALLREGYVEIGMDHFALPSDGLAKAAANGTLHRNFMGYSDNRTDVLLGLGVSAISEAPGCFHQNEKVLPVWEESIDRSEIPTYRGHILTADDRFHREQILRLMTKFEVELKDDSQVKDVEKFLAEMIQDRLVKIENRTLKVLPEGRPFLRNACLALDARLRAKTPEARTFSMSV